MAREHAGTAVISEGHKQVVNIKTAAAASKCSASNAIRIWPNGLKPLFGTPLVTHTALSIFSGKCNGVWETDIGVIPTLLICFSFLHTFADVCLCQNIRDLTPLTHEVISRQATINIGRCCTSFGLCTDYLLAYVCLTSLAVSMTFLIVAVTCNSSGIHEKRHVLLLCDHPMQCSTVEITLTQWPCMVCASRTFHQLCAQCPQEHRDYTNLYKLITADLHHCIYISE